MSYVYIQIPDIFCKLNFKPDHIFLTSTYWGVPTFERSSPILAPIAPLESPSLVHA